MSERAKHTQGPWRVVIERHRLYIYPRSPFDESRNSGHDISLPMHEHRSGAGRGQEVQWRGFDDEQKANARLIAAAPDLLEACQALLKQIDEGNLVRSIAHDHEEGWAMRQIPLVKALQDAQKAIRKATEGN